jgi:hypothetical protein
LDEDFFPSLISLGHVRVHLEGRIAIKGVDVGKKINGKAKIERFIQMIQNHQRKLTRTNEQTNKPHQQVYITSTLKKKEITTFHHILPPFLFSSYSPPILLLFSSYSPPALRLLPSIQIDESIAHLRFRTEK